MSEGVIVSNLGNAKYRVRLIYDNTGWQSKFDATIIAIAEAVALKAIKLAAWTEANLAWNLAKSRLDSAVTNGLDTEPYVWDVNQTYITNRKARIGYDRAKAAEVDALSSQRFLNAQKKSATIELDMWCADYDDTLAVDLHVGLLEINNENPSKQEYFIHPNKTHTADIGASAYDEARDGAMVGAVSMDDSAVWAYTHAMFIGWQRFQPLYRKATVTAVSGSTCNVSLDSAFSSHTPEGRQLGLNGADGAVDALVRTNVPIWYMDNGGTLDVGASVIVLYEGQEPNLPRVVGFSSSANTPPPNWTYVVNKSSLMMISKYFSLQNSFTVYDSSRRLFYEVSDTLIKVTEMHSQGSSTAEIVGAGFLPSLGVSFVTTTGLVITGSIHITVIISNGTADPLVTYTAASIPHPPIGDTSLATVSLVDEPSGDGEVKYVDGVIQWVEVAPATHEGMIQVSYLSYSSTYTSGASIRRDVITVKGWRSVTFSNGAYTEKAVGNDEEVSRVVQRSGSVGGSWITLSGSAVFYAEPLPIHINHGAGTSGDYFMTLFATGQNGVPFVSGTAPSSVNGSGTKVINYPPDDPSTVKEPYRYDDPLVSLRPYLRKQVFLHEIDELGEFTTTEVLGSAISLSLGGGATYQRMTLALTPWGLDSLGAFGEDPSGIVIPSDYDIWVMTNRAPLAKPTQTDPRI